MLSLKAAIAGAKGAAPGGGGGAMPGDRGGAAPGIGGAAPGIGGAAPGGLGAAPPGGRGTLLLDCSGSERYAAFPSAPVSIPDLPVFFSLGIPPASSPAS